MKRSLLIAVLAFGTIAGYGSGIAHMLHHHHGCEGHRGEATGALESR